MKDQKKWQPILNAHASLRGRFPGRVVSAIEVFDAMAGSENPPAAAACVWALQSIGAYEPLADELYLRSRVAPALYNQKPSRASRNAVARPKRAAKRGWVTADDPRALPGVYALYVGQELRYIGSAKNVAARLRSHERITEIGLPVTVKARYFEPKSFGWLTAEARLIHRLQPPMNRQFRGAVSWPR